MTSSSASSAATGPAVILIGPPGAGKTSVGQLLATLLGTGLTDTDSLVAEAAGKPVADIFIEDGEPSFRSLERAVVVTAIQTQRGVIALGGGAVLDPAAQRLLTGQRVVYLETGFAAVARRSGIDGPHPPLPGNPRGRLRQLLDERRRVYEELAWLTLRTDDSDEQEIAGQIAAAITASGASPGPELPS